MTTLESQKRGYPKAGARIVVAMSGGVDSSVAAALLCEQGFDVVGISLRLAPDRPLRTLPGSGKSSGCCSLEDFRDAGRVADSLGIAHYVFDMREQFGRNVVEPFVEEYLAGRTPSPCILCNREIKFGVLHAKARELGADFVATGHYAVREFDGQLYHLRCGRDRHKDQSYFLFEMGQAELASTLFPVGAMTKEEVRQHAARLGLVVAEKAESQEICFVADQRYAEFVEAVAGNRVRPGEIRDQRGRVLGHHHGVHRYTIGQRRGLGIAASEPLYVAALDAKSQTVTVAPRSALACAGLVAENTVWTSGQPLPPGSEIEVRIRYRHEAVVATLRDVDARQVSLEFALPEEAVSPGQAAVFYRGDEVVGGGWIRCAIDHRGEPASNPTAAAQG